MVNNFLPPDSQPWVRALENKVKTLEASITSLKKATTSRVSSAITTPGNVLTLGGEKVPGEGVLNGSLEHLNGVYTLRYGHEFHGLTQYVLIVSGKASGAGELSLLGPEGQVLDSDTLEIDPDVDPDVEDAIEFYFAVDFPIHTLNYEFEPEDEDGGGPDIDQEVVASYVLPDTGTLSLVTGATLSDLSYEIRSANRSQVTIDTSSGVPTITGLSADGTTIDAMDIHPDTLARLEELTDALEEAQRELEDAREEAEQNFGTLDDKLGQAFPDNIFDVNLAIEQAKDLADQKFNDSITGTVVEYALNSNETFPPVTGWSTTAPDRTPGSYVWMRTTVSYGSGDTTTTGPVLLTGNDGDKGDKGEPGSTGATGVSVTAIVPHFRQAASKPDQPSGTSPSGWSTTEPTYVAGTKLWRSERISYSNNTTEWTPVTEVATYTGIDAAMSMANGKNAASYTGVPVSVAEPGPTPTLAMGAGRPKYDIHRNRRTNGRIIGEWMWTGTAWTQLTLSDSMLSSLDVGKLTAGTANIETAVVNKLWGQLGVFDKLDVRTDAYVSGINLKDGAVTARTLNVVPDTGTGGLKADAYGIDVIGPDTGEATTYVSLRADQANAISFVQDGKSTFSVSPEGDLSAQTVAANDSLVYRGSELADLVGSGGQGIVSSAVARINKDLDLDGSERSLMKVNVPPRDASLGRRCFAIRFQMATSRPDHSIGVRIRQTQDGSDVTVASPLYYSTTVHGQSGLISGTVIAPLAADTDWNILLSCWSNSGGSIKAEMGTCLYVEDLGPAVPWDMQTPVSGGGGGTETTPTPTPVKTYTKTFSPTWTRSYMGGGGFYNYGAGRAYHGYYLSANGILGSGVGFSRSEISQFIGSGTVTKVEIYVKNSHSYSSSGMTAYWGVHSKTSVPATWSLSAGTQSTAFKKGEGKWITLPSSMWAGWKTSTSGVFFRPPSTSLNNYGYFDGNATRVRITVQK